MVIEEQNRWRYSIYRAIQSCLHKHEASFKAKYSVDASIVDTIWTVVDHRFYSCWHWRAECLPPQISDMRRSRRSRWCQDVYHRIYLAVYHRRMKNMMMLVMMMMMVSWIHLTRSSFYVITTCFPRGAACTMQTALQIQVIFDEIIKIAISVTVIAHILYY